MPITRCGRTFIRPQSVMAHQNRCGECRRLKDQPNATTEPNYVKSIELTGKQIELTKSLPVGQGQYHIGLKLNVLGRDTAGRGYWFDASPSGEKEGLAFDDECRLL